MKAAHALKKTKFTNDEKVAAAARIQALQDQWLLKNHKMNADLKAQLKKTKAAKQRQQAKQEKTREKAKEQAQIHNIRRLAIGNSQFGAFKNVLSDPTTIPSSDPLDLIRPIS